MPCPFTGRKIFCAGPNFFARPKIHLHIVAVTNILRRHKVFEEALNAVKKFGLAQNILGLVKGRGIRLIRNM